MPKAKIDLKGIINSIKSRYASDKASFEFYMRNAERLGILNADTGRKMIDLRGEKTPSTTVTKYLKYCDFGNEGKQHDIIHLIQEKYRATFQEAVKMLAEWEDVPLDSTTEFKPLVFEEETKVAPYKEGYLKKMVEDSFKNPKLFKTILDGLCRTCSIEEMRIAVKRFRIGLNSYEDKETKETLYRLFIPEFNEKNIPYGSYRYNRELKPKGLIRGKSVRVLFGSHLIPFFDIMKPILFNEGHSDTIVNNAKSMQSVTSGSSTTKIGKEGLESLKGRELHFYPDCDIPGMKGVSTKIMEIEAFNAEHEPEDRIRYRVYWWAKTFTDDKTGKKIGLKDLIAAQIKIYKSEDFHAPIEGRVTKWTFFPRENVKQGYDFIDFHNDYSSSKNYTAFKEKYSY